MFVAGNVIYNNGQIVFLILLLWVIRTVFYSSSNIVSIFATLTDDMGNPITGQNILFYIHGANVINVTAVEEIVKFIYIFVLESEYLIHGTYDGIRNFTIIIFDEIIAYKSDIGPNLSLNKDKIEITESDLKIVVKLPDNFVLDFVPDDAVYDASLDTLTWFIDTMVLGEFIVFDFVGYFTVIWKLHFQF